MAAALADMADLEELSRLSPLPSGSPGPAARGRAEPPEEEEEDDDDEAEAEAVAALLLNGGAGGGGAGGGEAETMSEPSPESASQAGGDEDDEEEDDEDGGSSSGGAEEESSAESLVGSSSGGCSGDETRSLSPGAASSSSGDGDGKEGLEEPKGPRGGPGGAGSGGGSSSSSVVSSGGDEGYGTGGGGSSATSGGRRGSLEMSSDGEPLSRMDSEDRSVRRHGNSGTQPRGLSGPRQGDSGDSFQTHWRGLLPDPTVGTPGTPLGSCLGDSSWTPFLARSPPTSWTCGPAVGTSSQRSYSLAQCKLLGSPKAPRGLFSPQSFPFLTAPSLPRPPVPLGDPFAVVPTPTPDSGTPDPGDFLSWISRPLNSQPLPQISTRKSRAAAAPL